VHRIMHVSSVAFLGPQNAPESLAAGLYSNSTALPRPPVEFNRAYFKATTSKGKEGGERRGEGAKMIYAPRRQKPSPCHCMMTVWRIEERLSELLCAVYIHQTVCAVHTHDSNMIGYTVLQVLYVWCI